MSIVIRSLRKSYDDFQVDVDLDIASDETLVLAGPSGCGKTTALQLIAGIIARDSGEVVVDGVDVSGLPAWKRDIGVVFQDLALFPHLSVGGNVGYGPRVRHASRRDRAETVRECLAAVRLSGYEGRRVDTLSGGERQRVAIARALAAEPRALLLDEPFSSLDAPLRRSLRAEFRSIRAAAGFPCIFVTHDREEAAALGDTIALMRDGRVVERGSPRALFTEPKTAFAALFLGSGAVVPLTDSGRAAGRRAESSGDLFERARERPGFPPIDRRPHGKLALLVPPDSIAIVSADSPRADFRALVLETSFEGDRASLLLETEGGIRLQAAASLRDALPEAGSTVGAALEARLIRVVADEA